MSESNHIDKTQKTPVSVRLPEYTTSKIDELVKKGLFKNRSEFIRYATAEVLGRINAEIAPDKTHKLTQKKLSRSERSNTEMKK